MSWVFVSACMSVQKTLQAYVYEHVPVQRSQHLNSVENHDCVFSLMLFHIVILRSRCNILLFRNPTINHLNYCWQTSKRFWVAAHFLSISNTQVDRNTKEQKLQKVVHVLCVCGSAAECVNLEIKVSKRVTWNVFTRSWKVKRYILSSLLDV